MNKIIPTNINEEVVDYSHYTDEEKEQIKKNNIEAIKLCKQLKSIFTDIKKEHNENK